MINMKMKPFIHILQQMLKLEMNVCLRAEMRLMDYFITNLMAAFLIRAGELIEILMQNLNWIWSRGFIG